MADAQLERTTAEINISNRDEKLVAKGEMVNFEGFLKVYLEGSDEEEEQKGMLPKLEEGDAVSMQEMQAVERFAKPKARFTEASLVKKLEELGIGRPSTYASTITTVQNRGYVEKGQREGVERQFNALSLKEGKVVEEIKTEKTGADKSKLIPTDIGMVVTDFLMEHFQQVMDYSFTADVEKEFDEIARGEKKWNEMIGQFYGDFHSRVEEVAENFGKSKRRALC